MKTFRLIGKKEIIALFCLALMLALPVQSALALSITNVKALQVTESSALVSWDTDQYSSSRVRYGAAASLGQEKSSSSFFKNHQISLTGLSDGKKYFFEVESVEVNGTLQKDDNSGQLYNFTTKDATPPEAVTGLKADNVDTASALVSWNAVSAPDLMHYRIYRDIVPIANTTSLSFQDSGLSHSSFYGYKVSAVDKSGNEGTKSNSLVIQTKTPDISAPVISSVSVADTAETSAKIIWVTDEDSTSSLYYGPNSTINQIKESKTLSKNHSILLQNLFKNWDYSFKVGSCDSKNNCANSSIQKFKTGKDVKNTLIPIFNVSIPRYANSKNIDILGTVEPSSEVRVYVNNFASPVRFLDSGKTANGKFSFFSVALEKENKVRVEAKDKSGSKKQLTFDVSVDTEKPNVVLGDIPSTTSKKNISIVGNADEQVQIDIYLTAAESTSAPPQIKNLRAEVGNNSVDLGWDVSNISNFNYYIIYRKDVGPIATNPSKSYNSLKDILVNSGESYTYQVSAVNLIGKEGEKSDPIAVNIPSGGRTNLEKPPVKGISKDARQLKKSLNATGTFSMSVVLADDGRYSLRIEITDRAGNKETIEKEIILDTLPPKIEIVNPKNGASIYENYADEVSIEGKTDPFAEVHIFVQRVPLPNGISLQNLTASGSFDVSGLAERLSDVSEDKLRANCDLAAGGRQFCSLGADFTTTADEQGRFVFDKVDLTKDFISGSLSAGQVSFSQLSNLREFKPDKTKPIIIIVATDQSGIRSAIQANYNVITCWSGNQTWSIYPIAKYPSLISVERLAENRQDIEIYFNLSYHGFGGNGRVTDVSLTRACEGTDLLKEDRFNMSCRILPAGALANRVNPSGTISYSAFRLNRIGGMDRWLEDDWKDFTKQLGTEVTFPFKFRITYRHTVDGVEKTETQTTCQEISYLVDNSKIDPRKVLPDWMLYDLVDILDESVKTLTEVQQQINKVAQYVAIGCGASFLLRFGVQAWRRLATFTEEKKFLVRSITGGEITFQTNGEVDSKYCEDVSKNILKEVLGKENQGINRFFGLQLKHFSDKDLKKCFPHIAALWEQESFLYQSYRYTCDRIFGHKSPSAWTETLPDQRLKEKVETGNVCRVDESVSAQVIPAQKCRDVARKYDKSSESFELDEICFEITEEVGRRTGLYKRIKPISSELRNEIWEISKVPGTGSNVREINYVIKKTDTTYYTYKPQTCAQVCGIPETSSGGQSKRLKDNQVKAQTETARLWECMSTNACLTLKDNKEEQGKYNLQGAKIESTRAAGYTSNCFYNPGATDPQELSQPASVSNNPAHRFECCCVGGKKETDQGYYQWDDLNLYSIPQGPGTYDSAFESKTEKGKAPQAKEIETTQGKINTGYVDMQWSYRYWKEAYQTRANLNNPFYQELYQQQGTDRATKHFSYNPERYMSGRDFPACFGFNHILYDTSVQPGETGSLLTIDSRTDLVSTIQCANIVGISNRITFLNNVQRLLANCFRDIRETGTSDSAVCKEVFTRYVCSSFWDVINYFQNSCSPASQALDEGPEDAYFQDVKNTFKSITDTATSTQAEVAEEYGNAKLNEFLGTGESSIARQVCMAAFGYDWDFGIDKLMDVAYAQPSESFVQAVPTANTRELLSPDPKTGTVNYEYRSAWIVNPGCDLSSYNVELACVSSAELNKPGVDCSSQNDPFGKNCDCLNSNKEVVKQFYSSTGRLSQNKLVEAVEVKQISDPVRYDHLKFSLRPDARIAGENAKICFGNKHYQGGQGIYYASLRDKTKKDVLNCFADAITGTLKCDSIPDFWNERGTASLLGAKLNGQELTKAQKIYVKEADPLDLEVTVFKAPGQGQCLEVELVGGPRTVTKVIDINIDGRYDYPVRIADNAQITTGISTTARFVDCAFDQNKLPLQPQSCSQAMRDRRLTVRTLREPTSPGDIVLEFRDVPSNFGQAGRIDLTERSEDILKVDNDAEKVLGRGIENNPGSGWWDPGMKAVVIDLNERGKYMISAVGYDANVEWVQYAINPPNANNKQAEQSFTLRYGLYHLKLNGTFCGSSNYDRSQPIAYANNPQTAGPFSIAVSTSAFSTASVAMEIDPSYQYPAGKDQDIKLSIKIENEVEFNEDISVAIIAPDQRQLPAMTARCNPVTASFASKISKQCELLVNLGTDLKGMAGTYQARISITDANNRKQQVTKNFEVPCMNDYSAYGICRRSTDTCPREYTDAGGVKKTSIDANDANDPNALRCIGGSNPFKCCYQIGFATGGGQASPASNTASQQNTAATQQAGIFPE
ncbi:hypothetical protein J4212_01370 [Candidatus Woesearchaeota archaeon]|nr:hypothetical protein [Candidatus Woesearchaeota archaeon]